MSSHSLLLFPKHISCLYISWMCWEWLSFKGWLNMFVLYLTYLCKKFYSKEIFPQYFFQFFIIPNYWCCESTFTYSCGPWVTVKKKCVLSKYSTEQYSIHNNLLHHSNFWVWNFGYRKNLYATILNYAQKSTVKNIYTFFKKNYLDCFLSFLLYKMKTFLMSNILNKTKQSKQLGNFTQDIPLGGSLISRS